MFKENILKHKLLFTFSLFLFVLFIFNFSNCFASTSIDTYKEKADALDGLVSYCIYYGNDGSVLLAGSRSSNFPVIVYNPGDGSIYAMKANYTNVNGCYVYTWDGTDFVNPRSCSYSGNSGNFGYNGTLFLYSSVDIVDGSDTSNIYFFQGTPASTTILAQKLEEVEMTTVLQEIILLLPLIIVVVVSLVGLRKALQILLTLLQRV